MSTITLPNIRVSSDLTVSVRLKDNGVAIDWSTLNNVKASIYSDAQRALAGRCDVSVDAEDPTVLVCQYAANKPQYVGVCRIVVSAKYMGETKTYDKPAFNFVRWTADQDGEQITIDDPDVDVEIEVSDVSSSLLDEAIRAAFTAAEEAVDAKGQVLETEAEVEAAEALRVSAEESRVEAEEGRAEAEAARVDEEAVRVSAEDARVVAENARAAAEDLREGAEDDRAAAETARETAEAARVAAEALRVTAEGSRETAEAAREAQASADHTVAAGDHTQAAADHTQAAADHTTAASDHTQAGADHTLAAADHVTAGEDHAQAQDDHEVMAGYDTRLGNVEGEVSQLEAKVTDLDEEVDGQNQEIENFKQTVTNQLNNYEPIVIEGDVTNAPDEEDITTDTNDLLKFADRNNLNGLGYVILRRNKTFAEQVVLANTIYEVRYDFNLGGDTINLPSGSILHFVGGSLDDGTIVGNGSEIVADNSVGFFGRSCFLLGTWKNETFLVEWWSCYADGTRDDRSVISGIAKTMEANGGGVLRFQFGKTYAVAFVHERIPGYPLSEDQIFAVENAKLEIDLNQAEIKVLPNGYQGCDLFFFRSCDMRMHGGKIIGDRLLHDYVTTSGTHEWGYGVYQYGGNGVFQDLEISQFTGTGLYIQCDITLPSTLNNYAYTEAKNIYFHHIRRGAFGYAGGSKLFIEGCSVSYIGASNGINGTSPMVGVGLEFEWYPKTGGEITIKDTDFLNCDGGSIVWSNNTNEDWDFVKITGCKMINAPVQVQKIADKPYVFDNCELSGDYVMNDRVYSLPRRVTNSKITGFATGITFYGGRAELENVVVQGKSNLDGTTGYFTLPNGGYFKNCSFDNLYGTTASTTIVAGLPYLGGLYMQTQTVTVSKLDFDGCTLKNMLIRTANGGNTPSDPPATFNGCYLEDLAYAADQRLVKFNNCDVVRIFGSPSFKAYFDNCRVSGRLRDFKYQFGDRDDMQDNLSKCCCYVKNSIWTAEMVYIAGYVATPSFVAENSQVKLVRMGGTYTPNVQRMFFKNCQVLTNFAQSYVTLENSSYSQFKNIYSGVSANLTINQDNVVALGNSAFWQDFGTITANAGEGEYIYIAIPYSFGNAKCVDYPITLAGTFDFIDSFGAEKYNVYKTTEASLGSVTLTIEADES